MSPWDSTNSRKTHKDALLCAVSEIESYTNNKMSGKSACTVVSVSILVLALLALSATLIGTAVHRVNTNEHGLFYDKLAKVIGPDHTQGLYAWRPFSRVIVLSAVYEPVDISVQCVTSDGLRVALNTSFQYVPQPDALVSIAKRFIDAGGFLHTVTAAATAAIHQTCSQFQISDYQNFRPVIQSKLADNLEAFLGDVNASALAAQLTNVGVPDAWNQAVFTKQQSDQDITLAENQRNQSVYQAQNNISLAQQDAAIVVQNIDTNVTIIGITAQQQASAIAAQYDNFADVCSTIVSTLNVTVNTLLELLTNRVLGSTGNTVDINLQHVGGS